MKKETVFRVISFLLSVTLAVLTADLLFQWYWKIPSTGQSKVLIHYLKSELPQKRLRPNLNASFVGAYREYTYQVTTTRDGFRTTLPAALNTAANHEIVLLGDSQTFGAGVNDSETFASLLSGQIGKSVLNGGVPGYNNIEALQLVRQILKTEQPKVVALCFFVGNDPYENFQNRRLLFDRGEFSQVAQPRLKKRNIFSLSGLKDFLKRNSSLYNGLARLRAYKTMNDLYFKLGLLDEGPPGEISVFQKQNEKKEKYWTITETVLEEINQVVRGSGAIFTIVFIPDKLQIDDHYWNAWVAKYRLDANAYDFEEPNKRLRSFCETNQIQFLDLTPLFQTSEQAGKHPYWTIDHHLSPEGHRLTAEALHRHLETLLLGTESLAHTNEQSATK